MAREFELRRQVELQASPEQVWEAIATAQGNAAWLFPTEDLHPDSPVVTSWRPPHRLSVRTPAAEDGSTQSFEYVIEAREGGTVVLRFVHSGILGTGWHDEYEDLTGLGWDMYLHTLAQYFRYFPGRTATYVSAEGPPSSADGAAWTKLLRALGFPTAPAIGDSIRLTPDGLAPLDGVVDYATPSFLGIRTADAMYRFHGRAALGLTIAVGHHLYESGVDKEKERKAWQEWLSSVFS